MTSYTSLIENDFRNKQNSLKESIHIREET